MAGWQFRTAPRMIALKMSDHRIDRHAVFIRCRAGARGRCRAARGGTGLLPRQNDHAVRRPAAGRRHRPRDAAGRAVLRQAHPGRAGHRAAQHAGRRRADPRQSSLQRREAGRPDARHARPLRLRAGADHQRRRHQIRPAQVHLDRQLGLEQFGAVDAPGVRTSRASTISRRPSARSSSPAAARPRRIRSSRKCWRSTRACRSRWCAAIPASPTRCWRSSAAKPTACCASAPASAPTCWRQARVVPVLQLFDMEPGVPLLQDLVNEPAREGAAGIAGGAAEARPRRDRAARDCPPS